MARNLKYPACNATQCVPGQIDASVPQRALSEVSDLIDATRLIADKLSHTKVYSLSDLELVKDLGRIQQRLAYLLGEMIQ